MDWRVLRMIGAPVYRRRGSVLVAVVFAVVSGFLAGRWPDGLESRMRGVLPSPVEASCANVLPAVSIAGVFEPPFSWPTAPVAEAEARVLISASPAPGCEGGLGSGGAGVPPACVAATRITAKATPTGQKGDVQTVRRCLQARVLAARDERLAALGLTARPGKVVSIDVADKPDWGRFSGTSVLLYMAMMMSAASIGGATLPHAKSTGLLESVLATGAARGRVANAYWWLVMGSGAWAVVAALAGLLLGGAFGTPVPVDAHWLLLPAALVGLTGAVLATLVGAAGPTDGNVRLVLPMFGPPVMMAVSRWLDSDGGHWGSLVPFGGALSLLLDSRPLTLLPALGACGVAGLCAWACHRHVLAGFASGSIVEPESGATSQRHASGDFLAEAFVLGLVPLPGMLLLFGVLQATDSWALGFIQVGSFAVPAILAPLALGLPVRRALGLHLPPPRSWLPLPGLVLATLAAGDLGMRLTPALLRASPAELGAFTDAVKDVSLVVMTLFAAVPEELLFRGAVQGLLSRRLKPWVAIPIQALLFAAVHGMLAKLLPVFMIGCVLGWLRWRTGSVLPGMLVHAAHNGLLLLGLYSLGGEWPLLLTVATGGALAVMITARLVPKAPPTTR